MHDFPYYISVSHSLFKMGGTIFVTMQLCLNASMHICVGGFCWLQENGLYMKWANSCFSEVNEWLKSEAVICNAWQPTIAPNLLTFPSCNVPVKAQSARISNYRKSPVWLWPLKEACCIVANRLRRSVWWICLVIHVLHHSLVCCQNLNDLSLN